MTYLSYYVYPSEGLDEYNEHIYEDHIEEFTNKKDAIAFAKKYSKEHNVACSVVKILIDENKDDTEEVWNNEEKF